MITFGKTASKPNFLFGKLPVYFKENDGGSKVVSGYEGEGTLERYMEIFCAEVDGEVSPFIDELLSITDAEALSGLTHPTPMDFLIHISGLFGNPPDIATVDAWSGDEDNYIALLRHIRQILQTKGTVKALELYLALYDYELDGAITESSVTQNRYDESTPLNYDDSGKYDYGFTFYSGYDICIKDLEGTSTKDPTQAWLDNYLKPTIQKFISPIWAELDSITYSGGNSILINDEDSVEWAIAGSGTEWRMILVGNNLQLEQKIATVWTLVDSWFYIDPVGDWKFNIDGSNNLAIQHDDSGWTDITIFYSGGGTLWRFIIMGDKDLELQQLVYSVWTKITGWTSL